MKSNLVLVSLFTAMLAVTSCAGGGSKTPEVIGSVTPEEIADYRGLVKLEGLETNLILNADAKAGNVRGNAAQFSAKMVTDGDIETYWATDDTVQATSIVVTFPQKQYFNRLIIQEYVPLGTRVGGYSIDYSIGDEWFPITPEEHTMTIGKRALLSFHAVEANALRVNIKESRGPLCISNIEAYMVPIVLNPPTIIRRSDNLVTIKVGSSDAELYYTIDGSEPTLESSKFEGSFEFKGKGVLKAIAYNPITKEVSKVATKTFDISSSCYTLLSAKAWAKGEKKFETRYRVVGKQIFDGNTDTKFVIPEGVEQSLEIALDKSYAIAGFIYAPIATGGATAISSYEFYVDGKKVADGTFEQIAEKPVEQTVTFPTVHQGKTIKLVAKEIVNGGKRAGFADFTIITK